MSSRIDRCFGRSEGRGFCRRGEGSAPNSPPVRFSLGFSRVSMDAKGEGFVAAERVRRQTLLHGKYFLVPVEAVWERRARVSSPLSC